jgi:TonB family protein
MRFFRLFLVLFVVQASVTASAQEAKWFQISTEHFLLFTDTTEAKGEKLLTDFEKRVEGFEQAFGKGRQRQFPIEVFLFKDHNDYVGAIPKQPLVDGVAPPEKNAYLLTGPDRLFIIAKDKSPEDIANDVGHALGHLLFEHEVMWRPFWLDEAAGEYVRKLGRNLDTKPVPQKDAYAVDDLLTIVPSATYQDNDPGGAFRTQSYRLLRLILDEKPQALKQFLIALDRENGRDAKLDIEVDAIRKDFAEYVEKSLPMAATIPAMESTPADLSKLAVHRGDMLLAADKNYEATRYYNANSPDARAARAIITRFSRSQTEAIPALSRAAQELPENGLVQYHFGALTIEKGKELEPQTAALQRALRLLPSFGRAYGELARLYTLTGKASQALPLVDKAVELEPEYADHFYEIRADALLALGRYDESFQAIKFAEALPHADRKTVEAFTLKVANVSKRIENARREIESRQVERLRHDVETTVNEREPIKPPEPPVVVREGTINYQIAATTTLEVVNAIYPDYPEELRRLGKSGKINLRVEIAPDGTVKSAVVASSQLPELNAATVEAAKKWTFKSPARARTSAVSITLSFIYQLQ